MRYAIRIKDVVIDGTVNVTALKDAIPAKADARIWGDEYTKDVSQVDGNTVINATIKFNDEAERDLVLVSLVDKITQIENKILSGSIRKHDCPHKEDSNKGCTETPEWSK